MTGRHSGIGMTSERTRARMIERLRGEGVKDEAVLAAMLETPRHIFVDEALASRAYEDAPLPIGFGQTISSPYIVARMSELLRGHAVLTRVLEVGTGCGYQTAILARLAKEVYSIERVGALLDKAREHLRSLRLRNIRFKHSDGSAGLPEAGPFDGIVVTAASTHVAQSLRAQLNDAGRMVLPVGLDEQWLYLIERKGNEFVETKLEAVRFVPLLPGVIR
jgi:protein-L-isoaspartate(D-aspartate) O-methyltransferase